MCQAFRLVVCSGSGTMHALSGRSQYVTVGGTRPSLRAATSSWISIVSVEPQVPITTSPRDSRNTSRRTTPEVSRPCSRTLPWLRSCSLGSRGDRTRRHPTRPATPFSRCSVSIRSDAARSAQRFVPIVAFLTAASTASMPSAPEKFSSTAAHAPTCWAIRA
eukprot:scaffold57659_cov42-Phaeocystis_antarctica.AAC.2